MHKFNHCMPLLRYCLASLFLLISSFCIGQTISTDRPDQTESATLVGLKSLQLESGILFSSVHEPFGNTVKHFVPSILFRYGMSKKIELRLYQEYETNRFELQNQALSGLKNLQIGLKFLLFQKRESTTEIAIISHVIVPTGSKTIDQNSFGIINKLAISHQIGEQLNIGYNLGYDFHGKNASKGTYAFAFGIKISDAFGMYAESYGEWENIDTFSNSFDTGLTYLLGKNMQVDLSYGVGLNHSMQFVSTGLSWNLGQISKK